MVFCLLGPKVRGSRKEGQGGREDGRKVMQAAEKGVYPSYRVILKVLRLYTLLSKTRGFAWSELAGEKVNKIWMFFAVYHPSNIAGSGVPREREEKKSWSF